MLAFLRRLIIPPRTTTWRHFVITHVRRTAITFAFLIPAMSAGILLAERDLMYWPDAVRRPPAASNLANVSEHTLATPDGERLVVWRSQPKPGQPTILYFHGNGEPLGYRAARIRLFQAEGYGVFMLAWRGFSGSTGKPSERANVADAGRAYDQLRAEGVAVADIVIYGESLGASVAVQTAITKPALAVILEAPFTSMVATWRQFVPFLPVGLLLRDQYRTIDVIGGLRAPLLILHGHRDWLVWFGQGQALFRAAPEPKRFAEFRDAAHMNLYRHSAIEAVRGFITDVRRGIELR